MLASQACNPFSFLFFNHRGRKDGTKTTEYISYSAFLNPCIPAFFLICMISRATFSNLRVIVVTFRDDYYSKNY